MSTLKPIRDEFNGDREISRTPECPPLNSSMIEEITKTVFIASNPQKSDVLFVFGCSQTHGWPGVAGLYHDKFAPVVFISGGQIKSKEILSHDIRKKLLEFGVPMEAIVIDEKSTNTLEDALYAKEIFERMVIPHKRILFACNGPHSGRCWRTLKKVFPDSELFPFVYDFMYEGKPINAKNWWDDEHSRRRVWGEYQRIFLYSSRGDICP